MSDIKGTTGKLLAVAGMAVGTGVLMAACSSPAAVPTSSTTPGGQPAGTPTQLLNAGVASLNAGDSKSAEADFKAVLSADPTNKFGDNKIAYYDLGVINQTNGNNSEAQADYGEAIKIDPNYTGALYNLAIVETASDPQGAIALYRQVIATSPSDVNAIYNLGLLLYYLGQKTEGRTYLKQAIQLAPSLQSKLPAGITLS